MTKAPEKRILEEQISDEMLMMYVDGELPPDQRQIVTASLPHNPELVKRLESFLFTRETLRGAFAETLNVPQQLIDKVPSAEQSSAAVGRAKPSLVNLFGLGRRRVGRMPVWAIAGVGAVLLAGATGWLLRDATQPDHTGLIAPPTLQHALEHALMRQSASLAGDVLMEPKLTFWSLQRRWCREFKLIYGNRTEAPALACRAAGGTWRVHLLEDPANPGAPRDSIPAGDRNPDASVSAYRDQIMGGRSVLTVEDESDLINNRWNRKP
jgi:hypothetical protein